MREITSPGASRQLFSLLCNVMLVGRGADNDVEKYLNAHLFVACNGGEMNPQFLTGACSSHF